MVNKKIDQLAIGFPRLVKPSGLRSVSLFSGAGGLDLGLESAGQGEITVEAWVEKDSDCQQTLQSNFLRATPRTIFSDIKTVKPRDLMAAARLEKGEAFLVAGGPPCQAFSTAGLRRSINEQRGEVVGNYFDVIRSLKPRFFVFENVRGLLSVAIKHRTYVDRMESEKRNPGEPDLPEDQRLGSVFQQVVLETLKRLGYEIVYGLVNTADYGCPQVRHRVVIIGSRDNELGSGKFRKITGQQMSIHDLLPATHHRLAPYEPIRPWRTLRDAIGHLAYHDPLPEESFTYSDDRKAVWKRIPPGAYWTYIRDNPALFPEGLPALLGGAYEAGGGKVGFWRRLGWDRPAPTLPTQPQHFATGLCHPTQERPLSLLEYAALQEFPPNYSFAGNKSSKYAQIGNAVPVSLGRAVGDLLLTVAGHKSTSASAPHSSGALDEVSPVNDSSVCRGQNSH